MSNELDSILEMMHMIGGTKEYQQALIFAAYVRLFKDELEFVICKNADGSEFSVTAQPTISQILQEDPKNRNFFYVVLPIKYLYLFEDIDILEKS